MDVYVDDEKVATLKYKWWERAFVGGEGKYVSGVPTYVYVDNESAVMVKAVGAGPVVLRNSVVYQTDFVTTRGEGRVAMPTLYMTTERAPRSTS